jgi:hypothetical protein
MDRWAVPARASPALAGGFEMPLASHGEAPAADIAAQCPYQERTVVNQTKTKPK